MRRRELIGTACLAGALAAMGETARAAEGGTGGREFLELRIYKAETAEVRARLDKFLAEAAIPAWNRTGMKPVGAFSLKDGSSPDVWVLMTHKTAECFITAPSRLWADAEYQKAAAFFDPPKAEPMYTRIETNLLLAFENAPKLQPQGDMKPDRIFQLRTYESSCEERARLKLDMFNSAELGLFRDAGMTWVFFGQSLAGTKMPNLTYMLGFPDEATQKAAWDKFGKSEGWNKLKNDPKYKDTVSNITNLILKPTAYSQI
ncbi:MAG: NIPSNAP family protein [Planctomycetota bacterium]|nr:NIPSNAP family protein [Planctomycetota bacterium]